MAERITAESAKQRSLRVPLDHFRHADALVRLKLALSAALVLLACGYVAWLLFSGRTGARHASPGQVASVHSAWNDDCQSCHLSFRPLSAGAVDLVSLAGVGPRSGTAAHRALVDQACEKCHAVAAHGNNLLANEIGSCASCHEEHRGAAADIVLPDDSDCTRCHADISVHRMLAGKTPIDNVTRFAAGAATGQAPHPAFRSLGSPDSGNLKFNHWLHMQPGIAPPGARQPLRAENGQAVQLECGRCHSPDAGGAYMLAISFEQHCRECHPLSIKSTQEGAPPLSVKHGLNAQELAAALDGLLWDEQRRELPASEPALDESGAAPLVPGKTLGGNLAQKLGGDLLVRREKAELAIGARCQQCHYAAADSPQSGLRELITTNVSVRWFQSARFDHAAHRHVADCRDCHKDAYEFEHKDQPQRIPVPGSPLPAATIAAADDETVMIADIEKCAECHSPTPTGKAAARHDCAECHAYHNAHLSGAASPFAPPVTSVSLQGVPATNNPPLAHLASCAASGCHGNAQDGAEAWRSSFATWLARDPHVHAAGILETHRAQEMTRLIAPGKDHNEVLAARCLNCHATDVTTAAMGVHCDSCHGNSSHWVHTHYVRPPAGNRSGLNQRASACMPCHVGPAGSGEQAQAVDHDLIAAGHPRLSFEFHAYFESLPAHWDRAKVASGTHIQSWLTGQQQHRAQLDLLTSYFENRSDGSRAELALFDCASCHHALETSRISSGQPRTPRYPRGNVSGNPPSEVVQDLLMRSADLDAGFEDAVQAYLAARAFAADHAGNPKADPLRAAMADLGRFLGRDCFGATNSRLPTPYDAPSPLDREALTRHVQAVRAALESLSQR